MNRIEEAYQFVTDTWLFYRQHAQPENSEAYWEAVVQQATALDEKYGSNEVMHSILLDILDALREESKNE